MSIVTLQHSPSRRSLAPASIRLRSIPLSHCAMSDGGRRASRSIASASMRLRSSRGRFLVALSLIAHCDSEARGRSR
jgi:hypothetical protein